MPGRTAANAVRASALLSTLGGRLEICGAYVFACLLFGFFVYQFHIPGKGFTYLVMFGAKDNARFIPELRAINRFDIPDSIGYDGAYYAQLAMHPQLSDPVLRTAIDNVPYRARRMLFSWTAYGLSFGNPPVALQIYALQNVACWFILAILLLRWFPATGWSNFLRWFAIMFSFGLCFSVRAALLDGPSLLLIAAGVYLVERGSIWWASLLLGVSGLGKETNVLAGSALAPTERNGVGPATALRLFVVVLPVALWIAIVRQWVGTTDAFESPNFAIPSAGYIGKWRELLADIRGHGFPSYVQGNAALICALTVQFLFFALRPRWKEVWWRIGATYCALMMLLGEAVWEAYPSASARVLLPMTLAFNVLVPRGRAWFLVFLLGNLSIIATPEMLKPPAGESYQVKGPSQLRLEEERGRTFEISFDDNWHGPERSTFERWNWSKGSASLTFRNPHPFAMRANVEFGLRTVSPRQVVVRTPSRVVWTSRLGQGQSSEVNLRDVVFPPGDTVWIFETDVAARQPRDADSRLIAFSVRNLEVKLLAKAVE